jgi:hypothetical protein
MAGITTSLFFSHLLRFDDEIIVEAKIGIRNIVDNLFCIFAELIKSIDKVPSNRLRTTIKITKLNKER